MGLNDPTKAAYPNPFELRRGAIEGETAELERGTTQVLYPWHLRPRQTF